MATVKTDDKHYKNIAQAIRDKTGGDAQYKPGEMADGVGEVYDAGYAKGQAEGGGGSYDEGYEAGQKAEYDRFWDIFQKNGNPANYYYKFAYSGWTDENFNPKYDIVTGSGTSSANAMFYSNKNITDTKVPIIVQGSSAANAFYDSNFVTIRKLVLHEGVSLNLTFSRCTALENIIFDGVIGQDIDFRYSGKLTNESVQSVIDHLKDLTGQNALTLTFHATVGGKLTEAQKATITAKNWTLVY